VSYQPHFLDWWVKRLATAKIEMRDDFVDRTNALCLALGKTGQVVKAIGVSFSLYHSTRKGVTPVSAKMLRKLEAAEGRISESLMPVRPMEEDVGEVPRKWIEDAEMALDILKSSQRKVWLESAASVLLTTANEIAAYLKGNKASPCATWHTEERVGA
jgi:hypothetical protein